MTSSCTSECKIIALRTHSYVSTDTVHKQYFIQYTPVTVGSGLTCIATTDGLNNDDNKLR